MTRAVAASLALLLALPALGTAAGETAQEPLRQQLARCAQQTAASARLACYDGLAARLAESTQGTSPNNSAASEPINEENALFKLSCAYFAKDC